MLKAIDYFLDRITMYRLVLYFLSVLVFTAIFFSFLGFLPYSPLTILFSTLFLTIMCRITNNIFSKVFKAPTNTESTYITSLILALIITPAFSINGIIFGGLAAILATSSKYLLVIYKKHLFNPAAIAVALTSFTINQSASWWVGNIFLLPLIIVGGLLIVRKIRKANLVFSFTTIAFLTILVFSTLQGNNTLAIVNELLLHSPFFFFAFIMLTEPSTTPPTKWMQMLYGSLVGFLFVSQIHLANLYLTPELALLIGNIFSYAVSPNQKLFLFLKEKTQLAPNLFDFVFSLPQKLSFNPGQYLEWTLQHKNVDSRGNRRYFTLASSPTESEIRLGVKFYDSGSSFKRALLALDQKTPLVAARLAGDFVLPKNPLEKCVFIAGGIGITPFRSMIKYLLDTHQSRPITILYSNKSPLEVIYKNIFDQADKELKIKTVYTLTDIASVPNNWYGKVGRIDAKIIEEEVPDYKECTFYLSGPHPMVTAFEEVLLSMGIKRKQIKTDFFPGYA